MYRRNKQARLLTGGLIGALPVTTPGDEYWNDVTLLLDGSSTTDLSTASSTVTPSGSGYTTGNTSGAKFGQYIDFQDSGYFNVALSSALGVSDEPFTVECWVRFDSLSNDGVFQLLGSGKSLDGTADGYETIALAGDSSNTWTVYDSVTGVGSLGSATTSTWYHAAAVYDGTNLNFYVDGMGLYSVARSMPAGGFPNVAIGGYYTTAYLLDGRIEDFRITKGVARYTSNFTPPTASFPTNAPVVGRRGVGSVPTALAVDTFATLDPTYTSGSATTLSEGNLKSVGSGAATNSFRVSTTEYDSNAKVYFELRLNTTEGSYQGVGVGWDENTDISGVCLLYYSGGSLTRYGPTGTTQQSSPSGGLSGLSAGAIIGVAADIGQGEVQFYVNGSTFGDKVTGATLTDLSKAAIFQIYSASATLNFGQDHTFAGQKGTLLTPYSDTNGVGEFYYEPPSGFLALADNYVVTDSLATTGVLSVSEMLQASL